MIQLVLHVEVRTVLMTATDVVITLQEIIAAHLHARNQILPSFFKRVFLFLSLKNNDPLNLLIFKLWFSMGKSENIPIISYL